MQCSGCITDYSPATEAVCEDEGAFIIQYIYTHDCCVHYRKLQCNLMYEKTYMPVCMVFATNTCIHMYVLYMYYVFRGTF